MTKSADTSMQDIRANFLVTPDTLDLDDPNLRLFDATVYLVPEKTGYRAESGYAKYAERHIPGANFLDLLGAFSDTTTRLRFTLPSQETLQAAFRAVGVSDNSRVVFYSGGHTMWATRAWWLAHYAGIPNIAVLDGGLSRWREEGRETTSSSADYPAGNVTISPNPDLIANADTVANAIDNKSICTINALSPEVYEGRSDIYYGRRGHIPGSLNLFYDALLLENGSFKPTPVIHTHLNERGLDKAEQVIAYCGGGIAATVDAFACLIAGYSNVAVYDGSMAEWAGDASRPLTKGTAP